MVEEGVGMGSALAARLQPVRVSETRVNSFNSSDLGTALS